MKAKILLVVLIVILIVLITVAAILEISKREKEEKEEKGLKEVEFAKRIYGFPAEIKEIQGKSLVLEGLIPLADAEREPVKKIVKAIVTDQTKIVKLEFPEEILADVSEPVYPKEMEIEFEELKIGEKVSISTIGNVSEKIKNGQEFEINKIFVTK